LLPLLFPENISGFVPKNNLILLDRANLRNAIERRFKRIEKVEFKRGFPDTLDVAVVERKLSLVLCSAGSCFVIDSNGVVYAQADFGSDELGEREMAVLNDDGNKNLKIGDQALSNDYLKYLSDIRDGLRSDLGLDIDKNYHTPQLVSGDIRMTTTEGWMVYFDASIPARKEIGTLRLVLDEKIEKDKQSSLEYVDLRTENKVYYKFKNSDQTQSGDNQPAVAPADSKKEESKKPKNT
jgi:cell division septal protein FtsQ